MGDMADYYDGRTDEDFDWHCEKYPAKRTRKKRASLGNQRTVSGTETATTIDVKCARCNDVFTAKKADRKRGWGKYCSKSCKAAKQYEKTGRQW